MRLWRKIKLTVKGLLKMKKTVCILLALTLIIGGNFFNAVDVFATTEPTIIMGNNAPMTLDEFTNWRNQRGIRHINIDDRIYPATIFFNWESGESFSYGEINDGILQVFRRPSAVVEIENVSVVHVETHLYEDSPPEQANAAPLTFTCNTSILFTDEELTAIIDRVPHQNALDTQSAITLPNRQLTETELASWITEYAEMGGATAFELAVVREINQVRVEYGLRPLVLDPALMMSARLKTQEFGDLQYFAHTSPVYGTPRAMAQVFGFEGSSVSETITQTGSSGLPELRTTPERIVEGMLASTRGHREILLNPNAYSVGFGSFFSPNSTGINGRMSHMFYHATKFGIL